MTHEERQERKKFSECAQMLIEGKVICDHIINEYGGTDDREIREIVDMITEATESAGRYSTLGEEEEELRKRISQFIESMKPM